MRTLDHGWIRWPLPRKAASAGMLLALLGGLALLTGCGASGTNSALPSNSSSNHSYAPSGDSGGSSVSNGANSATGQTQSTQVAAQYLIKSLNVSLTVPDTRVTAKDLENWIASTDKLSQTAGADYTTDGDAYDVNLTFVVQASLYPQIKDYLANYAGSHHGKLVSLHESVQNVTNDYLDTQTQLNNLLAEHQRLQTLMGQAQSLSDVLSIEQRLSDVEGQIQQINAHLSQLNGQTTYYTIQIQLTPISTYVDPASQAWDPGGVFHSALSAAKVFGEGLLSLLIWLGVFAVYFVPAGVIIWLLVRFNKRRAARRVVPAPAYAPPPPMPPMPPMQ